MKYYKDKTTGKFISKKAYIEQNSSCWIPEEEVKLMEKKRGFAFGFLEGILEGIFLVLTLLFIYSLIHLITSYLFL